MSAVQSARGNLGNDSSSRTSGWGESLAFLVCRTSYFSVHQRRACEDERGRRRFVQDHQFLFFVDHHVTLRNAASFCSSMLQLLRILQCTVVLLNMDVSSDHVRRFLDGTAGDEWLCCGESLDKNRYLHPKSPSVQAAPPRRVQHRSESSGGVPSLRTAAGGRHR